MSPRVTCDRFIGRDAELTAMLAVLREALSGHPGLVLLGGEAGIGKTRLTGEFERRVAGMADPPLILRGDAVPPSEGRLPFAPLVGALRPLVRNRHPVLDTLAETDRAQLAMLLPTLSLRTEASDSGGPVDHLRLFESLLALIAGVSEPSGVVLVLEDCHWADRSSLAFVDFLVRSMRTGRVAVVLTYRTGEPEQSEALRSLLGELHRHARARRITLGPFGRGELAEALTDILGGPPEPAVLARLLERSEGNPLYAEELLAADLDGRGALPESLSDAFLQRAERLDPVARRLGGAVAVGGSLDEPALVAVTGLSTVELAGPLREAITAQVLVATGADTFRFRHALLRETLYGDLLPGQRSALHLALARHREAELARHAGSDREFELALQAAAHFAAGGDPPSALRACLRAADLAVRAQAYERAADLLAEALELWHRVPDAEAVAGTEHAELLADAGAIHAQAGRPGDADTLLTAALDALEIDAAPRRCAEILFERAKTEEQLDRGIDATASAERALALIAEGDADPLRLAIRSWLTSRQMHVGRYREARPELEAMLATAVAAANPELQSGLLSMLGVALTRLGEPEAGFRSLREALALSEEIDDDLRGFEATYSLAALLAWSGRLVEARDVLRRALDVTPASSVRERSWLQLQLAVVALRAGDWQITRDCLDAVTGNAGESVSRVRLLRDAELAVGIGDHDRALACLQASAEKAERAPEDTFFAVHAALTAELHARRGEPAAAAEAIENATRRLASYPHEALRAADVRTLAVRVHADLAQRARDVGDRAAAQAAIARAAQHLDQLAAAEDTATPHDRALIAEARAHLARARGGERAEDWVRVAAAWEGLNMPYPAAVARLREAERRVLDDDRDAATVCIADALSVAERLGSRWLAEALRGLAERGRLALSSDDPDRPRSSEDPFDLTHRERQVLTRLALGETNRQIGRTLFISEKTVSAHVSRILAKLEVRGRTEAAAVAHRHGLTATRETM